MSDTPEMQRLQRWSEHVEVTAAPGSKLRDRYSLGDHTEGGFRFAGPDREGRVFWQHEDPTMLPANAAAEWAREPLTGAVDLVDLTPPKAPVTS